MSKNLKKTIGAAIVLIIALIAGGVGISNINITSNENEFKAEIKFAEEQAPAEITEGLEKVEYGRGEVKVDGENIPTVESVDANGPQVNPEDEEPTECPEGEECGRGAAYPYVDTSTPQAFINATLGGCYDLDGHYNEQCWDYAALFTLNYAGRTFYTCGTGAAKGAFADGCWQKNAGNEFVFTTNPADIIPGAIVGFNNGTFGHVGVATGYYNNGYVTLAGQNQGGGLCSGSTMGARVNIINISLKYFAGAFIPKSYIPKPEPKPEPTPAPVADQCKVWNVKRGDTLGKIMKTCKGEIKWGEAMNEYARHWYSTTFKVHLTVYDGWASANGVGLFAGDTIEYRTE
jgi:surface antigen